MDVVERDSADEQPEAPPQPPVHVDDSNPALIVDGIGEVDDNSIDTAEAIEPSVSSRKLVDAEAAPNTDADTRPGETSSDEETRNDATLLYSNVEAAELNSFAELLARFEVRVDKAATGRKYRDLRCAWDNALQEASRFPDRVNVVALAEGVVAALKAGCESAKVVVVDACLDCILRLIEYGHLGGSEDMTDIVLDKRSGTLDEVVGIVCSCLEVKEEEVYLRMVQTLLTAATLTKSGLHHGTLLAAVRTIYNIYLNAKLSSTRTTARVSLTQILNLVFSRMESESCEISTQYVSATPENAEGVQGNDTASISEVGKIDENNLNEGSDGHNVNQQVDKSQRITSKMSGDDPSDRSTEFSSILQKDAYLLFRALCKLSAKDMTDDSVGDSVSLRSKRLSLDLIRNLVAGSGPSFRCGERFVYALRHYLAPSLLTNCMSNSMEVVDISLDIFETLLRKESLRPLLKTEIGALFSTVIFRFLESSSAGISRRRRALSLLSRLCSDRQTLADLFLNYDCDLDSPKVFERIVRLLAQAAEAPGTGFSSAGLTALTSETGVSSAKEEELRLSALSGIVELVCSLRNWSKPIEDAKNEREAGNPANAPGSEVVIGDLPTVSVVHEDMNDGNTSTKVNGTLEFEKGSLPSSDGVFSSVHVASSDFSRLNSIIGIISEGSDQDTTRFEEALRAKRISEEGITQFNSKPKRGIDFLVTHGRLSRDPFAVANFLVRTEKLDATMVGEYLGDPDTFCVSVMHAYTDLRDMKDMSFDDALRAYLSGFRLPGESQKIDRIMEKFASRYCECNPDIFANAEVAFILAYSTIMLHTDAHNAMVKRKMTKDEFVRNNRGINDGADLPYEFLSALYDRTTTIEIRLAGSVKDSAHEAAVAAIGGSPLGIAGIDAAEKARRFKQESDELMAQTKVLFANRRKTAEDYTYFSASNVHHSRLMFEAGWCPVLAALSVLLEKASASDSNTVALCLEGFRNSIAIASTFGLITTKDAFVSSLAKFTHLNSIAEMRAKNVECARMILAIAALEGNNLGEQWVVIVRAISQIEQIRAVAAGNPKKFILQKASPKYPLSSFSTIRDPNGAVTAYVGGKTDPSTHSSVSSPKVLKGAVGNGTSNLLSGQSAVPSPTAWEPSLLESVTPSRRRSSLSSPGTSSLDRALMQVDSKAATVASLIDEAEIERIFVNSSSLSAVGVSDFCSALCVVALEELQEVTGPRSFCLQKIIEMAYYNMDTRTRIDWAKIWEHMGPFFASAMCHDNQDVSIYAVDALRQLASKFLEKDELSNFSFQRSFLKPFEECFVRSRSVLIREFVLTCISQIVISRAMNIKSGWKAVFSVLSLAADDKNESVLNLGFQIVESIVRKYFGQLDDVFVDAVTGISAFSRSQLSSSVALSAINLLTEKCAITLAEGRACHAAIPVQSSSVEKTDSESSSSAAENGAANSRLVGSLSNSDHFTADVEAHIGTWFPILTGLAAAMQDERSAVRMSACTGLFRVLENSGGRFSSSLWVLVYRGVISPMFDDVRHLAIGVYREEASATVEWATSTGSSALRALADVLVRHLNVTRVVLPDLLDLLRSWIVQENEAVAREGMSVLVWLMKNAGDKMISSDWDLLVRVVQGLFIDTMPHEILGPKKNLDLPQTTTAKLASNEGSEHLNLKRDADLDSNPSTDKLDGSLQKIDQAQEDNKIDFRIVRAKCVVQLLLIQLVQDTVVSFYLDISVDQILSLAASVESSYIFAHDFNANIELRFSLWRSGFMNQVPNLLKQETTGLTIYLRIMFWLYLDESKASDVSAELKLIPLCDSVLRGFIYACNEARVKPEERREVAALIPVVTLIVNGMMQMSNIQFCKHLPSMYPLLLELVEDSDDQVVRSAVVSLLRARISPFLKFPDKHDVSHDEFVPEPQVPGRVRERLLFIKMDSEGDLITTEVQSAVLKISGVRSVDVLDKTGKVRVLASAPDELLLSAISNLPHITNVTVAAGVLDSGELGS